MKTRISLTLLAVTVGLALHQPIAAQPTVTRTVFGNGATEADDGVFRIMGTLSQSTIGTLSGIDNQTRIGFWFSQTKSPTTAIEDVLADILDLNLPKGLEKASQGKLNKALKALDKDDPIKAVKGLLALVNKVEKGIEKEEISEEDATALTDQVQAIIDAVLLEGAGDGMLSGPVVGTSELISEVIHLDLPSKLETDLFNKLSKTIKELNKDKPDKAVKKLDDFIKKVNKESKKNNIAGPDADALIAAAQTLIDLIEGGGGGAPKRLAGLLPDSYGLSQSFPNPANPIAQITYRLPERGEVSLVIYNSLGQQIRVMTQGSRSAGYHTVTWDGTDGNGSSVSSGVYLYRFASQGLVETRRMVLLR